MMSSQSNQNHPSLTLIIAIVLAVWFALVFLLGARGAIVRPPGTPPLPLLIGFLVPLIVFLAGFRGLPAIRAYILALDLRLVTSKLFVVWNLLGILDLIVAVSDGALSSALAVGVPGEITTRPMAEFPLVLIPCFFVPIFIMLHLASLFQVRRASSKDL